MSRDLIILPRALEDVNDTAIFIARDNVEAGKRFLAASEQAYEKITEIPGLGALSRYNMPPLTGLRTYPIAGFDRYLVFY